MNSDLLGAASDLAAVTAASVALLVLVRNRRLDSQRQISQVSAWVDTSEQFVIALQGLPEEEVGLRTRVRQRVARAQNFGARALFARSKASSFIDELVAAYPPENGRGVQMVRVVVVNASDAALYDVGVALYSESSDGDRWTDSISAPILRPGEEISRHLPIKVELDGEGMPIETESRPVEIRASDNNGRRWERRANGRLRQVRRPRDGTRRFPLDLTKAELSVVAPLTAGQESRVYRSDR
ncbi:hypothetical protein [Solicola sp. PLA-1-18]|uniref:hypothetical protein n=1 Tax=Solicola sp. PLA-1-18 TaxID=3380532 RepID=UPI003B817F85